MLFAKTNFSYWLPFVAIIVLILFIPPLAFFVSVSGLAVVGILGQKKEHFSLFLVLLFGALFSTAISATSHPLFLYEESDFTTYYLNYLVFYNEGLHANVEEYFKFGSYIEFGIPILHYLFELIIDAPYPYLVRFFHSVLQIALLSAAVFKIAKFFSFSFKELSLVFSLTFLFFKFGATLNHLAQGYSSLFIVIGVFSKRRVNLWFLLAVCFHLSALLIYPLTRFLLRTESRPKLLLFCLSCLIISLFIYSMLSILSDLVSTSGSYLIKLQWAFTKVMEPEKVLGSLKLALIASMYLVLLLLINLIAFIQRKVTFPLCYNVLAILVFVVSFSYLPGISVRVMAPVLTVLLGFIYFRSLYTSKRLTQFPLVLSFLILFFPINWLIRSELYYYSYPMASYYPMYYVNSFFISKEEVTRSMLPSQEDIVIDNPHK